MDWLAYLRRDPTRIHSFPQVGLAMEAV